MSATAAGPAASEWRSPIDLAALSGNGSKAGPEGGTQPVKALRKRVPKFEPDLLCDEGRGIGKLYRMASSVDVYSGRGREISDMGRLMDLYRTWATRLYPHMSFDHVMDRIDSFGSKMMVKDELVQLRLRERERYEALTSSMSDGRRGDTGGHPEEAPPAAPSAPRPSAAEEFDAIRAATSGSGQAQGAARRPAAATAPALPDAPDDGDLDALLAEADRALQGRGRAGAGAPVPAIPEEDEEVGFEEDWEALDDL